MNALAAIATGAGLGLACYGSLWLGVRRMLSPLAPVLRGEGSGVRGSLFREKPGPLTPNPSPPQRGRGEKRIGLALGTGRAFRLVLVALTFSAIAQENASLVPAALAGLWLARRRLVVLASGGREPPVHRSQQGTHSPCSPFEEVARAD